MLDAVDFLLLVGDLGRAADEALAGGHINEDDRIVFRMEILFHDVVSGIRAFPTRREAEGASNFSPVKTTSQRSQKVFLQLSTKSACKR